MVQMLTPPPPPREKSCTSSCKYPLFSPCPVLRCRTVHLNLGWLGSINFTNNVTIRPPHPVCQTSLELSRKPLRHLYINLFLFIINSQNFPHVAPIAFFPSPYFVAITVSAYSGFVILTSLPSPTRLSTASFISCHLHGVLAQALRKFLVTLITKIRDKSLHKI